MRKYVRNQILEILSTVQDSIKAAKTLALPEAETVLTDCLLAIRTVEKTLQNTLSSERAAFYGQFLFDLENLLNEFYGCLLRHQHVTETAKKLKAVFQRVEKELAEEPEIYLEIAFMPYKASMWDALESIWRSAWQDTRCETFIVPLPYYDRKPDLQLGEYHYEGLLFPADIPILHYDDYDLSVRRPDIIYIHCPYDDRNYATSVDPAFYSSELKKYTDLLVYVPYFVSGRAISREFCRMPGIYNADRVIVQSEELRVQYSKNSGLPPSHFLPLGSPKFDSVVNAEKENFSLPAAWRERIKNKKVVLYNTGLSNMAGRNQQLAEKLSCVFSCFAERDDVVLWWRPHPLSRSAVLAMNPEFYQDYCALEEQYRQNHTGIFDDTPDLHRAIVFSDAYYGDHSSLIPLYEAIGKPVMLADINLRRRSDACCFRFDSCAVEGDFLYFSEGSFNGLFQKNLATGETSFLGRFPGEPELVRDLYVGMAQLNGKLFFAPARAHEIAVYDIAEKTFAKIPLPHIPAIVGGTKFCSCLSYKDDVFMIGCSCPAVIRIDSRTLETAVYTEWYTKNKSIFHQDIQQDILFRDNAAVAGSCFYIASCCCNAVLEFHMDTGKGKLFMVGNAANRYGGICYDGNCFWLSPRFAGSIVCWDKSRDTVLEYADLPGIEPNRVLGTVSALRVKNRIWFCFIRPPYLLEFNLETRKLEPGSAAVTGGFFFAKQIGRFVYALTAGDAENTLLIYDTEQEKQRSMEVPVPEGWRAVVNESEMVSMISDQKKGMLTESFVYSLENYLNLVAASQGLEHTAAIQENCDGKCGDRIHKSMMELGLKK